MSDFIIDAGMDGGYIFPVFHDDGTSLDLTGWTAEVTAYSSYDSKALHVWNSSNSNLLITGNEVLIEWFHTDSFNWSGAVYSAVIYSPAGKKGKIDSGYISINKGD